MSSKIAFGETLSDFAQTPPNALKLSQRILGYLMRRGKAATIIALLAGCVLFFSYKAGDIGSQFTGDENFYFQSSRNMVTSGDWLTPRYYGKPRFQKPFLFYWLIASSFKILGIDWYAARFPSIILAAFTIFLAYLTARLLIMDARLSILSAVILATTFKFFKYARFALPDMALLCFITLSFYAFLKKRPLLFFAAIALATLTKGPIGVIIPVLSIASFSLFSMKKGTGYFFASEDVFKKVACPIFLGIIIYFIMVLPWFLIMFKLHGDDFLAQLWTREVAQRVGYYSEAPERMGRVAEYLSALFFYIPIVLIRFLPWSIFLPTALIRGFSSAGRECEERRGLIFLLSWFFTVFTIFTLFGEKHSQYMLALTVPFALLVGSSIKKTLVPVILSVLTVLSFLYFLSNEDIRFNNAILGKFALNIVSYGLDDDDKVAMGSHGLIPQQLEVYLDRPVEKIGGKWHDPVYHNQMNKTQLADFFKQNYGNFCIIRREDYEQYLTPELRGHLKIIFKDYLWKRKITFKDLRSVNNLKEEYYLVTDK